MTKEQIFNYFYTNSANLGVKTIALVLLGGLLVGAIIYVTYWISYKGVSYNKKFNLSLVLMLEISVVIMLMISSNIVISLGMVGALSIVRFRTAIKDSRDTVFIFWAIAEGLSVGSQNFKLALITTVFIAIIIIGMEIKPRIYNKYLVVIRGKKIKLDNVVKIMESYVNDKKVRTTNISGELQETIIEIRVKGDINNEMIERITKMKGIEAVNYIVETGENLG
jgi:uncharacterized membrane protein YhiD involved in acid resistance